MAEFMAGDKVKVVKQVEECGDLWPESKLLGKEVTFIKTDSARHCWFEDPFGLIPAGICVASECLEKVEHSNKYSREIKPGVFVDVYDVLFAFNVVDPCLQHLAKKALCAGIRGHKDRLEDLMDIEKSIKRAIEMHKEWENKQ